MKHICLHVLYRVACSCSIIAAGVFIHPCHTPIPPVLICRPHTHLSLVPHPHTCPSLAPCPHTCPSSFAGHVPTCPSCHAHIPSHPHLWYGLHKCHHDLQLPGNC